MILAGAAASAQPILDGPWPEATAAEVLQPWDDLTAPLSFGGNDHLQALLLVPPLRAARILPAGAIHVQAGTEFARSDIVKAGDADAVGIDAGFWESGLSARAGVGGAVEVRAELTGSRWDVDDGLFVTDNGRAEIPASRIDRQFPSALQLGVKRPVADFLKSGRLSVALDGKLPWPDADDDLGSSGGADVAGALLASGWAFGFEAHANLGATLVGQESVFDDGIHLRHLLHGGVAAACPVTEGLAAVVQIQAVSSAFHGLEVLDRPAVSLIGGVRVRAGAVDVEIGAGGGLTGDAADAVFGIRTGVMF